MECCGIYKPSSITAYELTDQESFLACQEFLQRKSSQVCRVCRCVRKKKGSPPNGANKGICEFIPANAPSRTFWPRISCSLKTAAGRIVNFWSDATSMEDMDEEPLPMKHAIPPICAPVCRCKVAQDDLNCGRILPRNIKRMTLKKVCSPHEFETIHPTDLYKCKCGPRNDPLGRYGWYNHCEQNQK
ncbi:unnamed protein product [Cyprideis torosa]|uniref:Uncharacterized protein n=1 Tax=Cyprideis torosa TaxID=163714 RepID=A0A7R8ZN10_9CRUS|nr:unnamed protein product [Cyprideis torosa]CAG0895151.1 unnamed protein product [Cyprideis torosa]